MVGGMSSEMKEKILFEGKMRQRRPRSRRVNRRKMENSKCDQQIDRSWQMNMRQMSKGTKKGKKKDHKSKAQDQEDNQERREMRVANNCVVLKLDFFR